MTDDSGDQALSARGADKIAQALVAVAKKRRRVNPRAIERYCTEESMHDGKRIIRDRRHFDFAITRHSQWHIHSADSLTASVNHSQA